MQPPSEDKDDTIFIASQVRQIQTLQNTLNLAGTTHCEIVPSFETADDKENTSIFCSTFSS